MTPSPSPAERRERYQQNHPKRDEEHFTSSDEEFGVFKQKLQCLGLLKITRIVQTYVIFNIPPRTQASLALRSLQEKVDTVDRNQQLRVKRDKNADAGDGRSRGRGRGKGKGRGRGNRRKQVEKEQETDDWETGAAWEDWYHSEWEWDYKHGCWWWEVREKSKGTTKQEQKRKPGKETKVKVEGKKAKVEKENHTKETDDQVEIKIGANGKKRKAANQVEAEQDGHKAARTRERKSAPASSSKKDEKKKSKSQGKESKSVPKLEPTPQDRDAQILMLKTFALNNKRIKEDSLPVRQDLRDQLPPLQTCQLNIYWGEGRASCGLKHLKQKKNFGLYNLLNRDTKYIYKMAVAIKSAHMLATCSNSTVLLCQKLPYVQNTWFIYVAARILICFFQ